MIGCYYYRSAVLLISQASVPKKQKETLRQALALGKVIAAFTYSGGADYLSGHENYHGSFNATTQSGTVWDYFSKEWIPCFRRIVGVTIDGRYLSTPRAILRGLNEGTLQVTATDMIVLTTRECKGLDEVLESQSGVPRRKHDSQLYNTDNGIKSIGGNQYVMAGSLPQTSIRTRAVEASRPSGFSMSTIFADKTTQQEDKRLLKLKFADAVRGDHFTGVSSRPSEIARLFKLGLESGFPSDQSRNDPRLGSVKPDSSEPELKQPDAEIGA